MSIKTLIPFTFISICIFQIASCKKTDRDNKTDNDGINSSATYSVRMTDAPGQFQQVNVDIAGVYVKGAGGAETALNVNAGIYNLLDFSNGADTLIATGSIETGRVSQIRLILGQNNSVMVDSVVYPLSTPSAQQSGLKLLLNQTILAGVSYSILLDFDANQSVVLQGNGSYLLKPVIRVVDSAISGSIKGQVSPTGILTIVQAIYNGVSYSTVTDLNGNFILKGLPQGVYDVTLTPSSVYSPQTIKGVNVTVGVINQMGIITL